MSTQKAPPGARKPAAQAPSTRRSAAPSARRGPQGAAARNARRQGRDLFGLYFILAAGAFILLFGVAVWGLRGLASGGGAVPTFTAIPLTGLPVGATDETPLPITPPPSPTSPAPNALTSGAFAVADPLASQVVTDSSQVVEPAHLPAALPQAKLDLSDTAIFFGNVAPSAVLTRELTLANSGARDLVITQLATSCACVTVRVDARKLPSGTRTRMVVTYATALDPNESGFTSSHTLFLATTDGQNPLTKLTVSAVLP